MTTLSIIKRLSKTKTMKTRLLWYVFFTTFVILQYFYLGDQTAAFIEALFLVPLMLASEYIIALNVEIDESNREIIASLQNVTESQRSSLKSSDKLIELLHAKIDMLEEDNKYKLN